MSSEQIVKELVDKFNEFSQMLLQRKMYKGRADK